MAVTRRLSIPTTTTRTTITTRRFLYTSTVLLAKPPPPGPKQRPRVKDTKFNYNTDFSWGQDPDPDHVTYRRVTAKDLAHRKHSPTRVKMLVRDFIDDSLYNVSRLFQPKRRLIPMTRSFALAAQLWILFETGNHFLWNPSFIRDRLVKIQRIPTTRYQYEFDGQCCSF